MPPPPVFQALLLSFQVSLPGSPGLGTEYQRHSSLPVLASSAASQPRVPLSPAVATRTLPSTVSGAVRKRSRLPNSLATASFLSHTISPESRLRAMTRPSGRLAMTLSSHRALSHVGRTLPSCPAPAYFILTISPVRGSAR